MDVRVCACVRVRKREEQGTRGRKETGGFGLCHWGVCVNWHLVTALAPLLLTAATTAAASGAAGTAGCSWGLPPTIPSIPLSQWEARPGDQERGYLAHLSPGSGPEVLGEYLQSSARLPLPPAKGSIQPCTLPCPAGLYQVLGLGLGQSRGGRRNGLALVPCSPTDGLLLLCPGPGLCSALAATLLFLCLGCPIQPPGYAILHGGHVLCALGAPEV